MTGGGAAGALDGVPADAKYRPAISRTTPAARTKNKSWLRENGSRSIVVDDDNQSATRLCRNCVGCVPPGRRRTPLATPAAARHHSCNEAHRGPAWVRRASDGCYRRARVRRPHTASERRLPRSRLPGTDEPRVPFERTVRGAGSGRNAALRPLRERDEERHDGARRELPDPATCSDLSGNDDRPSARQIPFSAPGEGATGPRRPA